MPETTQPAPALTARETVTSWLAGFGDALTARDPAAAVALFTPDCFWRDLVAFTWNITTMEGRGEIADMLAATLKNVVPSGWQVTAGEEPAEADGIIEAWIDFETAVGRGRGQLRLRDGQCWTLLTTLDELKTKITESLKNWHERDSSADSLD
jgi:putative flavoprotein involved in K+ transport